MEDATRDMNVSGSPIEATYNAISVVAKFIGASCKVVGRSDGMKLSLAAVLW